MTYITYAVTQLLTIVVVVSLYYGYRAYGEMSGNFSIICWWVLLWGGVRSIQKKFSGGLKQNGGRSKTKKLKFTYGVGAGTK